MQKVTYKDLDDSQLADLHKHIKLDHEPMNILELEGVAHLSGKGLLMLTQMILKGEVGQVVVKNALQDINDIFARAETEGREVSTLESAVIEALKHPSLLMTDVELNPYDLQGEGSSAKYLSDITNLSNLAANALDYRNASAQLNENAQGHGFKVNKEARIHDREAKAVLLHALLAKGVIKWTDQPDWKASFKYGDEVGGIDYIRDRDGKANHPRIQYSVGDRGFKVPVKDDFDLGRIAERLNIDEAVIRPSRSVEGTRYAIVPEKVLDRVLNLPERALEPMVS